MLTQKQKDIYLIVEAIALILLAIAAISVIIMVFQSGTQCVASPGKYFAKELSEKNDAEFSCLCSPDEYGIASIFCNKEGCEIQSKKLGEFSDIEYKDLKEYNLTNLITP